MKCSPDSFFEACARPRGECNLEVQRVDGSTATIRSVVRIRRELHAERISGRATGQPVNWNGTEQGHSSV